MSTPDNTGAPSNPNNPFGDAAAATLAMINDANTADSAPTPVADNQTTEVATPAPEGTDGTTAPVTDGPAPLSWDAIDFTRPLTAEEAQFVKEHGLRHSDYTRKTQELAEQRKQYESLGDVEAVRAAVELAQSLQDPANLRQLKAEIEEYLAQEGQASAPVGAPTTDPANLSGLDPVIQAKLARIDEIDAKFAEMEHAQQEARLVDELTNKLQEAEDSIRATYTTYTQADIDQIYKLSPAHDYDLFAAQETYEAMRQHFTQGLLGGKDQIPDATGNVRSGALTHTPAEMNTMEAARAATKELFAQ